MTKRTITLAIIGGGSVATSFLAQLAQAIDLGKNSPITHVKIFDPTPKPGAGNAYQDDCISNLLNTRVVGMSALQSDPAHFYNWALNNEKRCSDLFRSVKITADAFVPRTIFGLYLNDVYQNAVSALQHRGVVIEHIKSMATSLREHCGRYEITTQTQQKMFSNLVVLSAGNLESIQFDHLRPSDKYFATPYPCKALGAAIPSDSCVGILGSSLSAIDAAISLVEAGHKGKILMISRNGRLPSVRGEHNLNRKPKLLSRENVDALAKRQGGQIRLVEIAQLLKTEIETHCDMQIDWADVLRQHEGPQRYIDNEIQEASIGDRVWQAVVYGLNDAIDLIWHYLPDGDRKVFDREFKSRWLSYRVSFPIENAKKLQTLLHTNQLSVYGGFNEANFDDSLGMFAINVSQGTPGFSASLHTNYLINATGYTSIVSQSRSPLFRNLIANGQATVHPFGGINAEFETSRVVSKSGHVHEDLYALGSMVSGTYFWTNAMNVNCRLAKGIVEQIINRANDLSSIVEPARSNTTTELEHA